MNKNKFKILKGIQKALEKIEESNIDIDDLSGELYYLRQGIKEISDVARKHSVKLGLTDLCVSLHNAESAIDGLVMDINLLKDREEELAYE
jgi:hypothetical protein